MEPWTFGVEPLPQALAVAPLLRRVAGLIQALEPDDPAVQQLIADLRAAEEALAEHAATDPVPRLGVDAPDDGPAVRRPLARTSARTTRASPSTTSSSTGTPRRAR